MAVGPIAGRALNSATLGNALAQRQLAPSLLADVLAAGGIPGAIRTGAGRAGQGASIVAGANEAVDPLPISIAGGRVGPVASQEELELLRAQMRQRAADAGF